MASHEIKKCERCGTAFECKMGNILQCQCYAVVLSAADKDFIARQYSDCLCANCLCQLKEQHKEQQHDDTGIIAAKD